MPGRLSTRWVADILSRFKSAVAQSPSISAALAVKINRARGVCPSSVSTFRNSLSRRQLNKGYADSTITGTQVGILTSARTDQPGPNIVLDNVVASGVGVFLQQEGGKVILTGAPGGVWTSGMRYIGGKGSKPQGSVPGLPAKDPSLMSNGKLFVKSRPQYQDLGSGNFLVATDQGIANDGKTDQRDKINAFLATAAARGQVAYFPAGIYLVADTVNVPVGSKIQGASWSQIMGTGPNFGDIKNPRVMVKVGNAGDVGSLEIVEMLFTVKGPTAGAILLEWNVKASSAGAAGMWDTHFRVGGALGSDLDMSKCAKGTVSDDCIAASLLFHVTKQSSGYFENVWVWTADQ